MNNIKFLIYGTKNGLPTYMEEILYSKCKTIDECKKVIEIIKEKSNNAYYNYRIADISNQNENFTKLFINAINK